jgi:hypothetical protein
VNDDFVDLLRCLLEAEAQFLVVGAHALAVHGVPRATGDLDIWIRCDEQNAARAWKGLQAFGAPLHALGIRQADLATPGIVAQIGMPPRRIDILTEISGVRFDDAWPRRVLRRVGNVEAAFLGREDFRSNKRASGRAKDLADIEALGDP